MESKAEIIVIQRTFSMPGYVVTEANFERIRKAAVRLMEKSSDEPIIEKIVFWTDNNQERQFTDLKKGIEVVNNEMLLISNSNISFEYRYTRGVTITFRKDGEIHVVAVGSSPLLHYEF